MRVLVAGDWHGNQAWALNVIARVPALLAGEHVRLILQLGDFGIWPDVVGQRYLASIDGALGQVGAHLWFIDGNHEDFSELAAIDVRAGMATRAGMVAAAGMAGDARPPGRVMVRPGIFHLPRGHRWQWHGRTWLACGGGVSLDRAARTEGTDWWPQEEITGEQEAAVIAGGHADVLVCHDCPAGVVHKFGRPPSWWAAADLARNEAHRRRLQRIVAAVRPSHLIHGHLHRTYQRTCDFGYGQVRVTGLCADGRLRNFAVLDVESMTWQMRRRGLLDFGRS